MLERRAVAKTDPPLRSLTRAAERVKRLETQLEHARQELYAEMRKAIAGDVSISAIARALGVSRQRIQKLLDRVGRE